MEDINDLFLEAIKLAANEFYLDGVNAFKHIAQTYPENSLADDALFNIGMCLFYMNMFEPAITTFRQVIQQYPNGTMYQYEGCTSFGAITAKCQYAIINCYLGLSNPTSAKLEFDQMLEANDAYAITPLGEHLPYWDLAKKALNAYQQFDI